MARKILLLVVFVSLSAALVFTTTDLIDYWTNLDGDEHVKFFDGILEGYTTTKGYSDQEMRDAHFQLNKLRKLVQNHCPSFKVDTHLSQLTVEIVGYCKQPADFSKMIFGQHYGTVSTAEQMEFFCGPRQSLELIEYLKCIYFHVLNFVLNSFDCFNQPEFDDLWGYVIPGGFKPRDFRITARYVEQLMVVALPKVLNAFWSIFCNDPVLFSYALELKEEMSPLSTFVNKVWAELESSGGNEFRLCLLMSNRLPGIPESNSSGRITICEALDKVGLRTITQYVSEEFAKVKDQEMKQILKKLDPILDSLMEKSKGGPMKEANLKIISDALCARGNPWATFYVEFALVPRGNMTRDEL